jgi:hypothetical protein
MRGFRRSCQLSPAAQLRGRLVTIHHNHPSSRATGACQRADDLDVLLLYGGGAPVILSGASHVHRRPSHSALDFPPS